MKRHFVLLMLGALCLAGGLAAAAGTASVASHSGPVTYTDATGDAGAAPDIRTVVVSDDGVSVQIALTADGLRANTRINVHLNTDKVGPFDYWIHYQRGAKSSWSWNVSHFVGGVWQRVPLSSTMSTTPSDTGCAFRLGTADLGGTTGFQFTVGSVLFDPVAKTATARDQAPDTGAWVYDLVKAEETTAAETTAARTTAALKPLIGRPVAVPATPRAGKRFAVSFPVLRSDNGKPATVTKLVCNPRVAGKLVPHREAANTGRVSVALVVPKTAAGKLLRVQLDVRAIGALTHKTAVFRIR